jgi:hypothetical protein
MVALEPQSIGLIDWKMPCSVSIAPDQGNLGTSCWEVGSTQPLLNVCSLPRVIGFESDKFTDVSYLISFLPFMKHVAISSWENCREMINLRFHGFWALRLTFLGSSTWSLFLSILNIKKTKRNMPNTTLTPNSTPTLGKTGARSGNWRPKPPAERGR